MRARVSGLQPVSELVVGVCEQTKKERSAPAQGPADLRRVRNVDLQHPPSLDELWKQAVAGGWPAGDASRLSFFALAAAAQRKAKNPAAYFVWAVGQKELTVITIADEEAARQKLQALR